jgi:hypothetical protein
MQLHTRAVDRFPLDESCIRDPAERQVCLEDVKVSGKLRWRVAHRPGGKWRT